MLFAQPLALIAFVALPFFYWLIKQLPPKPLVQYFAPMALLNPQNQEVTAHKPPLLLLIVRLLLVSSLILFCAKPYMAETSTHHTKNIHLYIPDDWGTAFAYTEIQKKAKQLIQQAELNNQQVYLQIIPPPLNTEILLCYLHVHYPQRRERLQTTQILSQRVDALRTGGAMKTVGSRVTSPSN